MNREEAIAELDAWALEPPKSVTIRGKVWHVRELSTAEMDRRLIDNKAEWQKDLAITTGATAVVCDPQGNLLFDPSNEADVKRIGKAQWSRISKIVNAMNTEDETSGN